jgi:hypothetical protein
MKWPIHDELLLIQGEHSFLLVGRAVSSFHLYIESSNEEFCEKVEPDDLVAVSSPEGGPLEPAVMLLELVRRYHLPLVVLPKSHPGSGRLGLVVSVSDEILASCAIQRGTHPEQHLICSSDEIAGVHLQGRDGAIRVEKIPPQVTIRCLKSQNGVTTK